MGGFRFSEVLRWNHLQNKIKTDQMLGIQRNKNEEKGPLKDKFLKMDVDQVNLKMVELSIEESFLFFLFVF